MHIAEAENVKKKLFILDSLLLGSHQCISVEIYGILLRSGFSIRDIHRKPNDVMTVRVIDVKMKEKRTGGGEEANLSWVV